jgi:hypothetical protein
VGAGGSIVVAINRDSDTPEGSWQASLTLTCALDCGGHDCRGFLLTEMTDGGEEKTWRGKSRNAATKAVGKRRSDSGVEEGERKSVHEGGLANSD